MIEMIVSIQSQITFIILNSEILNRLTYFIKDTLSSPQRHL